LSYLVKRTRIKAGCSDAIFAAQESKQHATHRCQSRQALAEPH
jgi:hypothetical protein